PGALGAALGARFCLGPAARGLAGGRGAFTTGTAAVGRGRFPVPAGATATRDVPLQARPDPGHRLSILAAEYPPAVSPAHRARVGDGLSRELRDTARAAGASLYRGRCTGAGHSLLAAGGPRISRTKALFAPPPGRPPPPAAPRARRGQRPQRPLSRPQQRRTARRRVVVQQPGPTAQERGGVWRRGFPVRGSRDGRLGTAWEGRWHMG